MRKKWFDPNEVLPVENRCVLVYCSANKCAYTASIDDGVWHYFGGRGKVEEKVDFWRHLPKDPVRESE